jgi:predicted DNA-binding transcriptional regulator YafY
VNIWFGNKRGERVLIEIEAPVAQYFTDRVYFPLQKTVKNNKNGSIVIETFPAHPDEIIHTIMHWIPYLKVVEPATFKEKVRISVKGYLNSL